MTNHRNRTTARPTGFTLIELLVVIAIIAILAGMIIAGAGYAMRAARIQRARTELTMLETAIEDYKAHRGHYPPDNASNPALPPLFYELTGTLLNGPTGSAVFTRIHGGETIPQGSVSNVFGIDGFVNSSSVVNPNDPKEVQEAEARDFMPKLQPGDYFGYQTNSTIVALLGVPIDGPIYMTATNSAHMNPFRYVSSSPTNHPDSYDLWIELNLRGKTNRISNWNPEPEIL